MSIPDSSNFSLSDVIDEVGPSSNNLLQCFANADAYRFDPAYSGSKDRLSNFRNYGAPTGFDANVSAHATIWYSSLAGWTAARSASSGVLKTSHPSGMWVNYSAGRYYVYRYFLTFDLTSINTGYNCSAADLSIREVAHYGTNLDVAVLFSSHSTTPVAGDFDNFTFGDYALSNSQSTSVYKTTEWIRTIYGSTSQAAVIKNYFGGYLKLAVINLYHDQGNSAPSSKQGTEGWVSGESITSDHTTPEIHLTLN